MTYPAKHGLSVHQGRWCKDRRTAKKPSRKSTVADKLIQRLKLTKSRRTMRKSKSGKKSWIMYSSSFIWKPLYKLMEILLFLSNTVVILRGAVSGNTVKP